MCKNANRGKGLHEVETRFERVSDICNVIIRANWRSALSPLFLSAPSAGRIARGPKRPSGGVECQCIGANSTKTLLSRNHSLSAPLATFSAVRAGQQKQCGGKNGILAEGKKPTGQIDSRVYQTLACHRQACRGAWPLVTSLSPPAASRTLS
jgi:hypothetical protein